jgi:prepilin-type N-terminal cleavage/methylation domain-containing protein
LALIGWRSGFALIEVIVSAAVLAIVALAVLSGIDGAGASSAREKARAVASSLAEQDQERLRSMPVEMLANPPQTPPVIVDGVTYDVASKAQWITDDTGRTPSCGNNSKQAEQKVSAATISFKSIPYDHATSGEST